MNIENKEQLAKTATEQYSGLRRSEERLDNLRENPVRVQDYRHFQDGKRAYMRRERDRSLLISQIVDIEMASEKLYREHHAELYDMAKEEMEAEGIDFSEGNS